MVDLLAGKQEVEGDEDGMAYRHRRLLRSNSYHQPPILKRGVGAFLARSRSAGFGQGTAQPLAALAGLARLALARALMVPGTHPGPTGQVAGGWELTHIEATSAVRTSAVRRLTPGMVSSRSSS